uniref:Uncharacterized protein n=1 Tax=Ciona intestinalis TaxID=7719 RepID=H2XQT5_CIOIN
MCCLNYYISFMLFNEFKMSSNKRFLLANDTSNNFTSSLLRIFSTKRIPEPFLTGIVPRITVPLLSNTFITSVLNFELNNSILPISSKTKIDFTSSV